MNLRNLIQIINESIDFELDSYKIYTYFSETFENESSFWKQLAEEELNHVSVLQKVILFYQGNEDIIDEISPSDIKEVIQCRSQIEELFNQFRNNPKREDAFKIAMKIEESSSESSYQNFMAKVSDNPVINMFQFLNGQEKDHLQRVKKRFKTKQG